MNGRRAIGREFGHAGTAFWLRRQGRQSITGAVKAKWRLTTFWVVGLLCFMP